MNENKNLPEIKSAGEGYLNKVKRFFSILCRNDITISRTRDILRMPVLAFLIIALLTLEISVPVILISLFCGVEYTIGGEDIPQKKISFRP
ncbi:MAG: hypothetical protein MSJ26_11690 [Oscillospiraceae bacterium]|nr:hypothetical protein [Oscillospiraceae bacterium]